MVQFLLRSIVKLQIIILFVKISYIKFALISNYSPLSSATFFLTFTSKMQSLFSTYLELGFNHILDLEGYDHILFLVALCAIYSLKQWRQVAILVTAFTIGHSLTLALAALDVIRVSAKWIEFLIPVTILATALYNVISQPDPELHQGKKWRINYLLALAFGLIHGLGFSNFLRSMLMPGEESSLVSQLFAFNVGVELGQLGIVAIILGLAFTFMHLLRVKSTDWNLFISGMAAGPALIMSLERIPFL